MMTIEERLRAYSHELDSAADRADARRGSPRTDAAMTPDRSGMRSWQTICVAAVTVSVLGVGLWTIADRDPAAVTSVPPTSVNAPGGTAIAGSPAPWYRLTAAGLHAQPVEQENCCETFGAAGPPFVVSWQAKTGPRDGLLVLTAYATGDDAESVAAPTANATLLPQANGSVWQFWSYGMTAQRRGALAALVVPGSGLPFVLPDESMVMLSMGGLGSGARTRTQTYFTSSTDEGARATDFATISVGGDRGLFRSFAQSESLDNATVAGMTAFRSDQSDGAVVFAWQATAGQWASLTIGPGLTDQADSIAASVVPDQSELLPPGATGPSNGETTESAALAAAASTTLAALGWDATLREHESRTPAEGVDVNWVYFSEPGRRLYVISGPAELLSTMPDLQRHLSSNPTAADGRAILVWPLETWVTTVALVTNDRTIIVRSEAVDTAGAARGPADLEVVLGAAATQWS